MALNLQAPFIPVENADVYNSRRGDSFTNAVRDHLNAVYPYPPTVPPAFPINQRYDGSGVGDENYNVGYHQLPVASGLINSWQAGRFEAPDVPVSHLPFASQIAASTFARSQSSNQPVYRNLRAPGINEGA